MLDEPEMMDRRETDENDRSESVRPLQFRLRTLFGLTAAMAELSADYQEVVVLRNLERLSFHEVAERMGRSRPATQMLWMRAIKKLQVAMEEKDGGEG